MFKTTISSTYYTDPLATHRVVTFSPDLGYGIYGYYNEFNAYRVHNEIVIAGYKAIIEKHDPTDSVPGVHPAIIANLHGYV